MIADQRRRLCGQCLGDRQTASATDTGRTDSLRAAAALLAQPEPAWAQGDWSSDDALDNRPTPELVMGLRGHAQQAVALSGRTDPASIDQATTARREAARYDDAILTRHADPYGAAMSTHAWETAGGIDDPNPPEQVKIRGWLASNPTARPQDVHRALNRIAELTVPADELEAHPWVTDLNRVAAFRAAELNGAAVDRDEAAAAESAWARHKMDVNN